MQVGMMIFRLGNLTDARKEVKSGREIFDAPFAADAFAVVAEPPLRHGFQVLSHFVGTQGWYATLAGAAMSFCQLGRGDRHGCFLPSVGPASRRSIPRHIRYFSEPPSDREPLVKHSRA